MLFVRLRLQYGIRLRTEKSTISIRRLNINLIVVINELVIGIFCHDIMSWVIWDGKWYICIVKYTEFIVCTGKFSQNQNNRSALIRSGHIFSVSAVLIILIHINSVRIIIKVCSGLADWFYVRFDSKYWRHLWGTTVA